MSLSTEQAGDAVRRNARWWKQLLAPLALLALAAALQLFALFNPQLTERYYSRRLYPRIEGALSLLGSLSGSSLAEVLLALLVVGLLLWLAWQARALYLRRRNWRELLLATLRRLLWTAGVAALIFMFSFGFNYQRQPLADNFALVQRDPSAIEIEVISRAVVEGINSNYAESGAQADETSSSRMPFSRAELYRIIEAAYREEPLLQGFEPGRLAPPKPVYFSGVMSRLGISGVYSPLTAEPNYNGAQPDCDMPFTIAHEMAHQRGFARESEANFVAFLVCIRAAHPFVRYSGYLNSLRVLGVLYRLAPDCYREVVATLGTGPRADLRARVRFWTRYEGRLSDFSERLNSVYLKANRVRSGVRNYNEMVELVIGYYLKQSAST